MKFYLPLHVLPLAFRHTKLIKDPVGVIGGVVKGSLRSSMLLAGMGFIARVV